MRPNYRTNLLAGRSKVAAETQGYSRRTHRFPGLEINTKGKTGHAGFCCMAHLREEASKLRER